MSTQSNSVLVLISLLILHLVLATFEFTNIKCEPLDKSFADFDYCFIKSVNRTYKYLSLKVNLYKIPITNATLQYGIYRRFNGYKPFMYIDKVDACKALRSQNNMVFNYIHGFFREYSNMNHTCPFDHDLIVDKLDISFLNNHVTKVLPWPAGDYALYTTWIAYNVPRADVRIYATIK